uniref:Uncharacterized protein n=1 Tax=Felis catus TaxID=9685 RepID=A0ABI7YX85_FELCA
MAASAFARAFRAASGVLRPLNILVSSACQNGVKNACLSSALSTRHFSSLQTPVVSSAPRLATSVRNLTCGHTAAILNRAAPLKNIQWKKDSLQQMILGKLDSNMQKNETGPLSYTIHKNKFKMDERPKYETKNHQTPRGEHR